jgi:hypothetical protein
MEHHSDQIFELDPFIARDGSITSSSSNLNNINETSRYMQRILLISFIQLINDFNLSFFLSKRCPVANCENIIDHIRSFGFPRNEDRKRKWKELGLISERNPKRLCIDHFKREDYVVRCKIKNNQSIISFELNSGVLPSNNLPDLVQ